MVLSSRAKYLEHHPGIEDVREVCKQAINYIATLITPIIAQYNLPDGWDDIHAWCDRVIMLPHQQPAASDKQAEIFLKELANYNAAKKTRARATINMLSIAFCLLCHRANGISRIIYAPSLYQ